MSVIVLSALLAVAPPTGLTVTLERVALVPTGAAPTTRVDPLLGVVELVGVRPAASARSRLCPSTTVTPKGATLDCQVHALWASIDRGPHGLALELRALTGLPGTVNEDGVPMRGWPLVVLRLPDTCPGTLAAARAECLLAAGDETGARAAYEEALHTADAELAHLRLGDFAAREGNYEEALAHYRAVPQTGVIGRLGLQRACELSGRCDEPATAAQLTTVGLEEPLKGELQLREVRRLLVHGEVDTALSRFATMAEATQSPCDWAIDLCQKITIVGLSSHSDGARASALKAFTSDQLHGGTHDDEVVALAAQAAQDLGAPLYAAAAWSSLTPRVPRAQLSEHLARVAGLYLTGGDRVRARVAFEYAENRLGAGQLTGAAWRSVRAALALAENPRPAAAAKKTAGPTLTHLEAETTLASELARAAAVRSRAVRDPDAAPAEGASTHE